MTTSHPMTNHPKITQKRTIKYVEQKEVSEVKKKECRGGRLRDTRQKNLGRIEGTN